MFDSDPAMIDAGSRYLHSVGPLYGLFGLGIGLYFASQGFGRLRSAVVANFTRLAIAVGGGWVALRITPDLTSVFVAVGLGLAAFAFRHFPMREVHPHAQHAAEVAEAAAAQGRFWDMHDRLCAGQDVLDDDSLLQYARANTGSGARSRRTRE